MSNLLEQCYSSALIQPENVKNFISDNVEWNLSFPINTLSCAEDIVTQYFSLIKHSLPDVERRAFISFEGSYNNEHWICATGYLVGSFENDLLDIPSTGKSLYLRFTEFAQITNDKISKVYSFLDFIDVMNQAGVNPIRPSLGHDGLIMPPSTLDGIKQECLNNAQSQDSLNLVEAMLTELGNYDGKSLASMELEAFWHDDFVWYGPAGIGTTRGIKGFRQHHQGPFLKGFPDRGINKTVCFISHGNYAATGGWPHMYGTHTGDDWLGLKASGKKVYPRVMDIWRKEGSKLKENWVAIDIPDMLNQMGIDIFKEMKNNTIKTSK